MEPVITRAAREFPAVVLTGPRQSGKTTLLQRLFGTGYRYVSLELPDIRAAAVDDPRGFMETFAPPVIFDEIQYSPHLLSYIKERIDAHRRETGQYLLTGSQNLLMMDRVTESLAGRAAILRLMPLSHREMQGIPHKPFPWEANRPVSTQQGYSYNRLWNIFLRGGYPDLAVSPRRDSNLWYSSYLQSYLERDVRTLRQIGDLTQIQQFIRMLAARSGQLLNLAALARDLGIALNTAKAWLSILEATYQVIIVRPYFANVGKRLVKTPKVYFSDTGILCYLADLKTSEHAASGPMGGAIFETAVVSEIFKSMLHKGVEPRIFFWRTSAGTEVDLIVQTGGILVPIEVKLSSTPRPRMATSVKSFQSDLKDRASSGYVIHPGELTLPLGRGVTALPFGEL